MSGELKKNHIMIITICVALIFAVSAASDDHSNSFADATKIKKSGSGRLESRGDVDLFRVNLKKGRTYTIEVSGKADVRMELFNADEEIIGADSGYQGKTKPKLFRITREREQVYIAVSGSKPKSTGKYRFTISNKRSFRGKPIPRADHAIAFNSKTYRTLLFGGAYGATTFDDMWKWDGLDWEWIDTSIRPHSRSRHCMTFDPERNEYVMFGGQSIDGIYGDTWIFDGSDWTEKQVEGPEPRQGATMVYNESTKEVMLFGGHNGDMYYNDLWSWNGSKWKKVFPSGNESPAVDDEPKRRAFHGMAYVNTENAIYIYGGMNEGLRSMDDTWRWNGEKWEEIEATQWGQGARKSIGFAYQIEEDRLYLFGGHNGYSKIYGDGRYMERWWDSYTQVMHYYWYTFWWYPYDSGPAARSGHTFIYDPFRDELMLFGGWNNGVLYNDTWIYRDGSWEQLD